MKKMERKVEAIMPPATEVPTELRAPAPAPVATARGRTPRMKANEVMRMGRRRMRPASTAASAIPRPRSRSCSANSTIRIEFLAARPMSMTSPTWQNTSLARPRSSWAPRPPTTARGTPEQDDEGQHPALVLGGQHQVDDQEAQPEEVDHLGARLLLLQGLARPGEVEARGAGPPGRAAPWPGARRRSSTPARARR